MLAPRAYARRARPLQVGGSGANGCSDACAGRQCPEHHLPGVGAQDKLTNTGTFLSPIGDSPPSRGPTRSPCFRFEMAPRLRTDSLEPGNHKHPHTVSNAPKHDCPGSVVMAKKGSGSDGRCSSASVYDAMLTKAAALPQTGALCAKRKTRADLSALLAVGYVTWLSKLPSDRPPIVTCVVPVQSQAGLHRHCTHDESRAMSPHTHDT